MTPSVRPKPRVPGALTTVFFRCTAQPWPRPAGWWRGIVSRRGQAAALRALPEIALERITHTRPGSWGIALPGGGTVTVAARRPPATDGVLWLVVPRGNGPCLSDSDQRVLAERAIARLAAELGLPRRPTEDLGVTGLPR